jgi:hypothetical protein
MQNLPIKDLPLNEEMDSDTMAAIQGGRMKIPGLNGANTALPWYYNPKQNLGGELLDDTSDSSDDALNPAGV